MLVRTGVAAAALLSAGLLAAACSSAPGSLTSAGGGIVAVGAENEYANVIGQIGGKYVHVTAIESNPNTDPHSFEASPSVAQVVSAAQLIVQNGLGYDTFMNKIEAAAPNSGRKVIDVQKLLGLPDSHAEPAPVVRRRRRCRPWRKAMAADLSALQPAHAAVLPGQPGQFDRSLQPWYQALAQFKAAYPRHAGRDHRAGRRLPAAGGGRADSHPVQASRRTS